MGRNIVGFRWVAGAAVATVFATACGSATPTSPTGTSQVLPVAIMLMEGHVFPEEVTIAVGDRVSFMNHDQGSYTVAGGRAPTIPCPELDAVGVLAAGATRTTERFTTAKTCDFQAVRHQSPPLIGRIIVR